MPDGVCPGCGQYLGSYGHLFQPCPQTRTADADAREILTYVLEPFDGEFGNAWRLLVAIRQLLTVCSDKEVLKEAVNEIVCLTKNEYGA